jgi:hypothetical protein
MALDAGNPYFVDKVIVFDAGYPYFVDKVIARMPNVYRKK